MDPISKQRLGPNKGIWHYTPPLPLGASPYFHWPLDLVAIAKWIYNAWLPLSERLIILVIAFVTWLYLYPDLEQTQTLSVGWIAQIYFRNLALMILVAGGLHLYFYIWRRQGDERRYDTRPFPTDHRKFTFNSQVLDNIFWTLCSGVTIWSTYEVLMIWALANGYTPLLSMPQDLVWLALLIFLLPMWETFHFFLIHRLIHFSPLYERVHRLHHRNTNVGPWSGMSMHPVEHLIYLSTVLIHFIVPAHPLLITFHLMYFTLSAATTHTGYQGITYKNRLVLPLGTFHHQLHHRYFECNYGGLEVPMDQWTGNFHNGTAESHKAFLNRRRQKANI